jgi:hypothetical protein
MSFITLPSDCAYDLRTGSLPIFAFWTNIFISAAILSKYLNFKHPGVSFMLFWQGTWWGGLSRAAFPQNYSSILVMLICTVVCVHDVTRKQGVTKRCRRLSWLTNSALVYMSPNVWGGRGGVAGSQSANEYSCTQSPNKLGRSNSIFNLCCEAML